MPWPNIKRENGVTRSGLVSAWMAWCIFHKHSKLNYKPSGWNIIQDLPALGKSNCEWSHSLPASCTTKLQTWPKFTFPPDWLQSCIHVIQHSLSTVSECVFLESHLQALSEQEFSFRSVSCSNGHIKKSLSHLEFITWKQRLVLCSLSLFFAFQFLVFGRTQASWGLTSPYTFQVHCQNKMIKEFWYTPIKKSYNDHTEFFGNGLLFSMMQ